MDSHTAERIFKQLDASFTFPAQQREEASVPVRYYPDVDKHFLGCYYHEGIFVVSYNRKLLVETAKKSNRRTPAQIIPELADLISKKGKSGAMNLFIQSASLDLQVQMNDSTEWKNEKINGWQWIYSIMKGSLCCFNEQPYEETLENFYPNLCDTITTGSIGYSSLNKNHGTSQS